MLTTATTGTEGGVKKLVVAVVMCLIAASTDAAFGQSGRVGWDGTWVGGWEKGTGVQLIAADGGRTFAWDKGEASLTPDAQWLDVAGCPRTRQAGSVDTAEAGRTIAELEAAGPVIASRSDISTVKKMREVDALRRVSPIQHHLCPEVTAEA